jgi:hypothetical protein
MKPSHRGRANDKVMAKCLVAVNEKEINPSVLLKMISEKSLINRIMLVLFLFSSTENSFSIALKILRRMK